MKYKVTEQRANCTVLTDCPGHDIKDCLKCVEGFSWESTNEYTQEEYLRLLSRGNVVITKVEVIE
jgi:hypothetical protein